MNLAALLVLCPILALAGCAGPSTTLTAATADAKEAGPEDRLIGEKRWPPSQGVTLCPAHGTTASTSKDCFKVPSSTSLTVTRIVYGKYGIVDAYELKAADGRTGYINQIYYLETDDERRKKTAAKADCDRRGGVRVGMSRAEVYASCWGKPERINSTIGSYGKHEQLVYRGNNYVYLEDGIVRSIQISE
jgi:hypothetical protein